MRYFLNGTDTNREIAYRFLIYGAMGFLLFACQPIRDFQTISGDYIKTDIKPKYPLPSKGLKTVILIADNKSTEIFDLLAPYFLFKCADKANVFIVSKDPAPISLFRGLGVMPHHTFDSYIDLDIIPDLIIVPNMSSIDKDSIDVDIVSFINSQYDPDSTWVLSICSGAAIAAQTGIFDGHEITSHSSDIEQLSQQWNRPKWIYDMKVTQSGNLFSTAGVSNATEGSLFVISKLFGPEIAEGLAQRIGYPKKFLDFEKEHKPLNILDKLNILVKVAFHNDKKLGFLLNDNISEFNLAALMDVYSRTFPESIHTFSVGDKTVISQNGLTLLPSNKDIDFDEVHMITDSNENPELDIIGHLKVHRWDGHYIFDSSLHKIEKEFGPNFKNTVSKLLDYEN